MTFAFNRLAYITSMATGGLAGFNFRELREMRALRVSVAIFVTKYRPGPYMPPADVPLFAVRPGAVVTSQLAAFLRAPGRYVSLFLHAIRTHTLPCFLIACDWQRQMRRLRCDWIHCHWGDRKLYTGYYCHRLTGLPLSVTMHGYDLYQNPNWAMLKICLDACSRVITISEFNRRLLRKKYPDLTDDKLHVVRLSADMPEDVDLFSKVKLLIVGGFQPRKGYDILLRAIRSLGRPDLHLWIVGYKGPVDVRGLVQELQLQKHVTILGQISDDVLKVLYQACDIFCMPSRFDQDGVGEGLPVALMEAMSYRKAVIATRHTGIPELVPDVLVDENDVEGLARGIAALADAPEQRRSMGERNRRIVEREYSNENVKRLLETLRP